MDSFYGAGHARRERVGAEAALQFVVKTEVDINFFVPGTVERAGGSIGVAARGIDPVGKKNKLWRRIANACLLRQDLAPRILGSLENR